MKGRFIIHSTPNSLEVVEEILRTLENELTLTEQCAFNVRLALSEAINNAIKHGNDFNPSKLVIIDVESVHQRLYCCVSDEGMGFDLTEWEDPRLLANREKEGGRGVLFLREITKHFHYCNESRSAKFSIDLS